ncbi:MAG: anti-sigma factor RsiW [Chlamydiales bacterium]|jgi:anti-sigma factor RsiW
MKCTEAQAHFSDYIEDELSARDAEFVAAHLETCGACRAGLESMRYALGDLQSLSLRPTSRAEVDAVMAAVDRAQVKPMATSWKPMLSHLAAAGLGATMVWISWPAETPVGPQIVERIVEVEVPFEVERIVEVPVPVEIPVEVERIVEVPVEVERLVRVETPLQFHGDLMLSFTGAFAALAEIAVESADLEAPELPLAMSDDSRSTRSAVASPVRDTPRSPVRVVRSGDRVSLQTRGSTEEVVPALIAMLSTEDARLQRVIEEQLENIRGMPGVPGADRARREQAQASPNALSSFKALINGPSSADEPSDVPSSPELWRTWWDARSTELAALDTRATY